MIAVPAHDGPIFSPLGSREWCRVGHGLPDGLTLNEKKRPTVALALDGLMKWGATAGIPTGGWVVVGKLEEVVGAGGAVGAGAGPPDAEVRLVDGALVVPACVVVVFAVVPVGEPYCRHRPGNGAVKVHVGVHRGHRERQRLRARRGLGLVGVLDVEDRLARLHERLEGETSSYCQHCSFTVPSAERFNVGDKTVAIDVISRKTRHTETVDDAGHLGHESELVGHRQGEAGAVGIRVVEVRFHTVEALVFTQLEAGSQDLPEGQPIGPGSSDHCRMSRYRSSV